MNEKDWDDMVDHALKRKLLNQRARFAAMAMQGILARRAGEEDEVAFHAVKFADALIEELKK